MNRDKIKAELKAIQGRSSLLPAQAVVTWAKRHPTSELHKHFQWDITKAAGQYWLWQARELIKIVIVSEPNTPQWISLSIDRSGDDGGYRDTEQVLNAPRLRDVLLRDVVAELVRLRSRYSDLHELNKVYAAIDEMAVRITPRLPAQASGASRSKAASA